jgi:hypothetical protein
MPAEGHEYQDRVSLEIARRVAARLRSDLSVLDIARDNLRRWNTQHQASPSLLACNREWADLLEKGRDCVIPMLLLENDEGQRLRQNSPFVGVLTAAEVWSIKQAERQGNRDEQSAA